MKPKVILLFMLLFSSVYAARYCNLDVAIYKDGRTELINFKLENLTRGNFISEPNGSYTISVLTGDNQETFSTEFALMFMLFTDPPQIIEPDGISWDIPCPENASSIVIYHKEKEIFKLDNLQEHLCNHDSNCGKYENSLSCPSDCGPSGGDGYCNKAEDGICDPDCYRTQDPDCIRTGGGKLVQALRDNYCNTTRDGVCDMDCKLAEDPDCITADGIKIYSWDDKCNPAKDGACDMDCERRDPDCLQVKEMYPPEKGPAGSLSDIIGGFVPRVSAGELAMTVLRLLGALIVIYFLYVNFFKVREKG